LKEQHLGCEEHVSCTKAAENKPAIRSLTPSKRERLKRDAVGTEQQWIKIMTGKVLVRVMCGVYAELTKTI
jgi:hypothetical protein